MKQTDLGIFLHRTSYSESSVIASFYTLNHGIQKYIFQGAKKKTNSLFPINICELTYFRRQDSDLGKLTQVDNAVLLEGILTNPVRSIIAFFMADVIRNVLHTNEAEPVIFHFLKNQIVELETTSNLGDFPLLFLAQFTEHIGIHPALTDEQPLFFNYIEGEFHTDIRLGEWCEEGQMVQVLHNLFEHQQVHPATRKQALEILLQYYKIHIPRFDIGKSLEVIREVLQE